MHAAQVAQAADRDIVERVLSQASRWRRVRSNERQRHVLKRQRVGQAEHELERELTHT